MLDFFREDLEALDPAVARLIDFEEERQARKLILIPSESQAPAAVREALGSVFQNIYAEGYPAPSFHGLAEQDILDYEVQLAGYRRNSDQRYYKGVEYADILEALARRRAAEAFAANGVAPESVWANVQPLSGSPANNAVYTALVPPGSTVMGMDLLHGGHLTHGSPANRSGKWYNIIAYGIDPSTERLDYDAVEEMARRHKPRMIIAGFTSYPWMPDWARFRQIADAVGAYLLADIAHIAGMVAAGAVRSPVGYADVVSFTTHKTLYGPRGACILTTDKRLAEKIDAAVFPGEQGGPHVNAIAGMAVAFRLACTPAFAQLQQQVVANAAHLADALARQGMRIPYGGTDTHMLLVDCKSIRAPSGVSPDGKRGTPLMGDPAARILDLAGIVLNRNTIPGDKSARSPSGIRLGTPWITQRGFHDAEIERLAEIIARVLKGCEPMAYAGRHGPLYHARLPFDLLEKAKWDVVDLASHVNLGPDYVPSGYPHHYFLYKPTRDPGGEWDVIEIEGARRRGFCNVAMTNDVYALGPGQSQLTWVLEAGGRPICGAVLKRPGPEPTRFQLLVRKADEPRAAHWLRALSDGFVTMDPVDRFVKAPGPVVVRRLPHQLAESWSERPPAVECFQGEGCGWALHKPYWVGLRGPAAGNEGQGAGNGELRAGHSVDAESLASGGLTPLPAFSWEPSANAPVRHTRLYEWHRAAGAKMAPFAGYEMPIQYIAALEEHLAVRRAAGLFDVSHLGLFEFGGENVYLFLNTIASNDVSLIDVGGSQYSCLLAPDGKVIDDAWIYRLGRQRYWMAVNAANNDKDWAWISAVHAGAVSIDPKRPWSHALATETVTVRDLRDPAAGAGMRAQLALQGPASRDVLLALAGDDAAARDALAGMCRTQALELCLAGHDICVTRTGYTGEPLAFEFFVHPDTLVFLWRDLLRAGKPFGVLPVGLAAHDSLRIEAGLPLYGHELAGPLDLNPADAGIAPYVKLAKPFFIGKGAYLAHEATRRGRLVRFHVDDAHTPVPSLGDVIVSRKGRVVGTVTSCSSDSEGGLVGLGYVEEGNHERGTRLGVYRLAGKHWGHDSLTTLQMGDRLELPLDITIIERFLNKK